MDGSVAFSDAVARAKQIAAKLTTPGAAPPVQAFGAPAALPLTGGMPEKGNPNQMPLGNKRAFPGDGDDVGSKRLAAEAESDAITAQLRAIADQQRNNSAKDLARMQAEQVAAKLSQNLGGGGAPPQMGGGGHPGLGMVTAEEWSVPNKYVGLVIGSRGENISNIQTQSGCRIQIAPDPMPGQHIDQRQVSLNGSAESIAKAKELINKTLSESSMVQNAGGNPNEPQGGACNTEMMIPANKVGLVIGKGGETIKSLQQRSGAKMIMVQDGPFTNAPEKPLKISGNDNNTIESARRLVKELLESKDMGREPGFGGSMGGDGGFNQTESTPVPRDAVGIIIGKGGEQIKNIQQRFGVRIQFQNDGGGPQRMCDISGNPNDVFAAKNHVLDLIQQNANGDGPRGGRGGPGGFGGRDRGGDRGGPRGGDGRFHGGDDTHMMKVPADRCGIVIGKGGENIRQICQISGAHVELNRGGPVGPDKEFTIRGTPDQIQNAVQLINEKVAVPPRGQERERGGPGISTSISSDFIHDY